MKNRWTYVLSICLLFAGLALQAQTVSGKVVDAADGSPLIGVNILVKGSTSGTVTDLDGNFTVKASPEDVLIFSYTGYLDQEVQVGNQSQLNISMEAGSELLDEVIVVGYGSQKKGDVTVAISSVSSEELEVAPIT
ncbi:MAG: TonB-dependent receptor, partial [Bacteroidetes bacterium]